MNQSHFTIPAAGLLIVAAGFMVSGILLFLVKKRALASVLLAPGLLALGVLQWDRSHETVTKRPAILVKGELVKENSAHPEQSLFMVEVADTDMPAGVKGRATAADLNGAGPGNQVQVEIAERPLTGAYLKSIKGVRY